MLDVTKKRLGQLLAMHSVSEKNEDEIINLYDLNLYALWLFFYFVKFRLLFVISIIFLIQSLIMWNAFQVNYDNLRKTDEWKFV